MAGQDLCGVALVQRHGVTVAEWAGGLADHDRGDACTRSTRFQLCSVSKQFTAAAVLLLVDGGLMTLNDPLSRWFSGCPEAWRPITIRQLLTHTAGLGHWPDGAELDLGQPVPPEQQLAAFQRMPLVSRPGTQWSYSSPGYVLLARIVQAVADQPYAIFLAERIFDPLGLRSTTAGVAPGGPAMARGYRSGQPVASFDLSSASLGTGDVWSTADDLLRWDQALAAGELLTPESRREMLTAHASIPADQPPDPTWNVAGYGFGWFIGTAAGRRAYFHPGDNPGYLSFNAWLPDDDIRLAVLSNEETTDLDQVIRELLRLAITDQPGGA